MAARTDLRIDILEGISEPDLDRYAKVSIQFTSAEKYEVREREGGGFALGLCALPESISTDFDAHEHPTEWVKWDLRNAAMFEAHLGGRLVGGAVVVRDMPKLNLLAARDGRKHEGPFCPEGALLGKPDSATGSVSRPSRPWRSRWAGQMKAQTRSISPSQGNSDAAARTPAWAR